MHTAARNIRDATGEGDGRGIGLRFPRFVRLRTDKKVEDSTTVQQILQFYNEQFAFKGTKEGMDVEDDDYF